MKLHIAMINDNVINPTVYSLLYSPNIRSINTNNIYNIAKDISNINSILKTLIFFL